MLNSESCCLDRLFAAWFPPECVIGASLVALVVGGCYSSTSEMASFYARRWQLLRFSSHARGSRCLQRDGGVISLSPSPSQAQLGSTLRPPRCAQRCVLRCLCLGVRPGNQEKHGASLSRCCEVESNRPLRETQSRVAAESQQSRSFLPAI